MGEIPPKGLPNPVEIRQENRRGSALEGNRETGTIRPLFSRGFLVAGKVGRMARWAIWLLVCASVFTAGCRGTSYPDLFHPGTIPQQLHSAERFDPYPDNDAGPTMEGVRPPGFDRPWPEPVQARWTFPNGRPPAQ